MAMIKRIKNNSGADKFVLTRTIANGEYYDVPYKLWVQALDDEDIVADIASGALIMNDGTSDLNATDGQKWLERFQVEHTSVKNTMYPMLFSRKGGSQNKFMYYPSHEMPSNETFALMAFKSKLVGITFSNKNSGVDTDVEIWRSTEGNSANESQVYNWQLRNVRVARKTNISPDLIFNPGDKIAIFLDDEGTNSKNAVVVLYLQIIEETSEESSENFSGTF